MSEGRFNYEARVFGTGKARISPTYIPALKLQYACQALANVEGRILDIGCGGGGMTKALAHYRPDLEISGIDLSRRSLVRATSKEHKVPFCCGDASSVPFPDQIFDGVVMFDFLEHLENPLLVLQEAQRILRPGGTLHIAVPFEGEVKTLHGILWRLGWKAKRILCGHVQMYEFGEAERLLQNAGFRIRDRRWSAHFFYQLADVAYFSWLYARGKSVPYSVEGYLEVAAPSLRSMAVYAAKAFIASVSYLESSILQNFPAGFGHFTCVDSNNEW